jgi:hypothetical protein
MFRSGAVDAFLAGEPSWFRDALSNNEAVGWVPKAPLRLFFGDDDLDVPPDDSVRAATEMRARGGNVELMPLGPCDHNEVVYRGVARVRAWFADIVEGRRDHPDAAKHQ